MKTPILRTITVFFAIMLIISCNAKDDDPIIGSLSIIIDHNCTDITKIPSQSIEAAKQTLHIAYGHTSHGSQITDAMSGLVEFANRGGKGLSLSKDIFAWNHGGTDGALDLEDYAMGGDVGYYPDWYNNTIDFLGDVNPETGMGKKNPDVNVIMWSWCGQAAGYSENQMINQYLTPMNQLEAIYFNVKFVYMTCHLDGSGKDGNLNLRNEQIRNYCTTNKKILYDFADIESYDPDGKVNYMELNCNDNCDYTTSSGESKNWAIDWQNTHTENVDWYACSAAHSQALNGNRKAFAAWWMFARLAGWNPNATSSVINQTETGISWSIAGNWLNIQFSEPIKVEKVELIDLNGKILYSEVLNNVPKNLYPVNLNGIENNNLIIFRLTSEGKSYTGKFVKN
jgi:hypothetical protein